MKTRSEQLEELMKNEFFINLFLDGFLKDDIIDIVYRENVRNTEVQDLLIARRIFREYIEQIIDERNEDE